MENKLYMANTDDMYLESYGTNMAKKIHKSFPIPFRKTNNSERDEYIELLTGTIYHKENDKYISEDSLVSFTTLYDYDLELFNCLSKIYSLDSIALSMKLIYYKNRKLDKKKTSELSIEERKNKVLKKLRIKPKRN